jgi:O-antigen/teichoic acid export membrane protein
MKFFNKKSHFTKNIFKLITGIIIVQLVTFLSQPIITRLYNPHDYGIFATIQAIIILPAYLSSLCYDRAIVVAKNDFESLALTKICIISGIFRAV